MREKLQYVSKDLIEAFHMLDDERCGEIPKKAFMEALLRIFINSGLTRGDVEEVAVNLDLYEDGYISYDEVRNLCGDDRVSDAGREPSMRSSQAGSRYESAPGGGYDMPPKGGGKGGTPRVGSERARVEAERVVADFRVAVDRRFTSLRNAFRQFNKDRTSSLSAAEFAAALRSQGLYLHPDAEEDCRRIFDPNDTGRISYSDFCKVMSSRQQFAARS